MSYISPDGGESEMLGTGAYCIIALGLILVAAFVISSIMEFLS